MKSHPILISIFILTSSCSESTLSGTSGGKTAKSNETLTVQGKSIFGYYCTHCHGQKAEGDLASNLTNKHAISGFDSAQSRINSCFQTMRF